MNAVRVGQSVTVTGVVTAVGPKYLGSTELGVIVEVVGTDGKTYSLNAPLEMLRDAS